MNWLRDTLNNKSKMCPHAVKYSKFSNIGIQYQFSKNLNFQLEDLKIFSLLPQIPQICIISTMPVPASVAWNFARTLMTLSSNFYSKLVSLIGGF